MFGRGIRGKITILCIEKGHSDFFSKTIGYFEYNTLKDMIPFKSHIQYRYSRCSQYVVNLHEKY